MFAQPLAEGIPTSLDQVVSQYGPALVSAAVTVVVFVVAFLVLYGVARPVFVRLTKRALDARGFNQTIQGFGGTMADAVALFAAMALAATIAGFGTVLAAFATLLGALALAVGFAAQDLIGNFVAGVFILRDEPFETGDWIEWNDASGVVREIRLRVTRLETFDNELITVPNSELADNAVTNPMANQRLRVAFTFGIGYDDDIDQAREIILEEAARLDGTLADPEPSVILTELADSYVGLTARVWIEEASRSKYVSVRSALVQAVKERFDAEGVDMPYPYTQLTGGIEVETTDGSDAIGPTSADD